MPKINTEEVIRLYVEERMTQKEVAKKMHCGLYSVENILRSNNIHRSGEIKRKIKDNIEEITMLYKNGITLREISKDYNCTGEYIRKILSRNGINTSVKVDIDGDLLSNLIFEQNYSFKQLCDYFECSSRPVRKKMQELGVNRMPSKYEKDIRTEVKVCNLCGTEKKLGEFDVKIRNGKKIFYTYCKECAAQESKNLREKRKIKNKNNVPSKKKKKCSRCKVLKDISCFSKSLTNPDGFQYLCKSCQSKDFKKYSKNHPYVTSNSSRKRREREAGVKNNYTKKHYYITMMVFDSKCFNCGSKKNLTIDHHKPLFHGYALSIDNAVVLCKPCNSSKKDIMPEDFYSKKQIKEIKKLFKKAKKILKYGNDSKKMDHNLRMEVLNDWENDAGRIRENCEKY